MNWETWRGRAGKSSIALTGGATRVRGQWSGPAGVWFASWPTASVIRRHSLTFVIVLRGELVGARGAFLKGFVAVALEHEGGGAPDVDVGYHTGKVAGLGSLNL